ncbi:MAG: YcgL domain-containing protein [Spongiibacteraceae bacterium]
MKRLCAIYRSSKVDEMYLYVDLRDDLKRVPEALLEHFGKPQLTTKMVLEPTRKLARADVNKVLQEIDSKGFYLQMPPQKEDYLLDLHRDKTSDHMGPGGNS